MFLGYGERIKRYRLWSLKTKGTKLIISSDFIFNEKLFPYLEKTNLAGAKENKYETEQTNPI